MKLTLVKNRRGKDCGAQYRLKGLKKDHHLYYKRWHTYTDIKMLIQAGAEIQVFDADGREQTHAYMQRLAREHLEIYLGNKELPQLIELIKKDVYGPNLSL